MPCLQTQRLPLRAASSTSTVAATSTVPTVAATDSDLNLPPHVEPVIEITAPDIALASPNAAAVNNRAEAPAEQSPQDVTATATTTAGKKSTRARKVKNPYIGLAFIGGEVEEDLHELLAVILDEVDNEDNDIDLFGDDAPANFKQMLLRPDVAEWMEAVELENQSISEHQVFEIVESLPHGKNLIKSMYIFKRKSDGRYKARLVAKGYSQKHGVDYNEVYAPVVSKITLRALLSLASVENRNIFQMDVKTAFLHAKLDDELYMSPPDGMQLPKGTVLKLKKSLYLAAPKIVQAVRRLDETPKTLPK